MFRKWNAAINLKTRTRKMQEIIVEVDEVGFRVLPSSPCIPYYIYPCGFHDQLVRNV
jgi:hypothetical protein